MALLKYPMDEKSQKRSKNEIERGISQLVLKEKNWNNAGNQRLLKNIYFIENLCPTNITNGRHGKYFISFSLMR